MADDIAAVLAAKRTALERQLDVLTASQSDTGGISFGKRVGEGTSLAVERLSQVAAHDQDNRSRFTAYGLLAATGFNAVGDFDEVIRPFPG
jgi:DnaK suppressor protein